MVLKIFQEQASVLDDFVAILRQDSPAEDALEGCFLTRYHVVEANIKDFERWKTIQKQSRSSKFVFQPRGSQSETEGSECIRSTECLCQSFGCGETTKCMALGCPWKGGCHIPQSNSFTNASQTVTYFCTLT
jgi:hypothetical protein